MIPLRIHSHSHANHCILSATIALTDTEEIWCTARLEFQIRGYPIYQDQGFELSSPRKYVCIVDMNHPKTPFCICSFTKVVVAVGLFFWNVAPAMNFQLFWAHEGLIDSWDFMIQMLQPKKHTQNSAFYLGSEVRRLQQWNRCETHHHTLSCGEHCFHHRGVSESWCQWCFRSQPFRPWRHTKEIQHDSVHWYFSYTESLQGAEMLVGKARARLVSLDWWWIWWLLKMADSHGFLQSRQHVCKIARSWRFCMIFVYFCAILTTSLILALIKPHSV